MLKVACFDLDHTLIYDIHSVLYPCLLNGRYDEAREIDKKEESGTLDWIDADHLRAALIEGLHVDLIKENFEKTVKPIQKIKCTIGELQKRGIKCILITAGPAQVARAAAECWGFDAYYGSIYEVNADRFTGKIITHTGDKGKALYLSEYCKENGYLPDECIAIGDGGTDIPTFDYCGASIAINYSESIIGKAKFYLKTEDLSDILRFII